MRARGTRAVSLTMIVSMVLLLLAACGGTGTDSGTGASAAPDSGAASAPAASSANEAGGGAADATPAAEASTGAAASGGAAAGGACPEQAQGQQITMWSPLTGPDGDEMTGLATQFSNENASGIRVQHLPQPEYIQKLNTAATGNSLPDLTVVRADDIAEMAARNILKPMSDEMLAAAGEDLEGAFPEQVWNVGQYNDQRFAIPLDVHPLVLYYNKDLFAAAGLEEPGSEPLTREEFEAAAEALNKDGVAGVSIGTAFQAATLFQTLTRQFGGRVVNEEGTEAAYNSPEGVEALTYLNELKQKYSPSISGAGDPEVTAFQQGKAGMVIHGPWHISNLSKLPFTGFAPVPQWGDDYAVWGGSHQLAVTTEDPARALAAACWIGWLSENSVQWAKAGQVPIRESARTSEELATVAAPVAAFQAEAEQVIMPPPVPGVTGAVWGEGYGPVVDAVLGGQQTNIEQALNDAAQKSNQIIQENAQRYGAQ